VAVEDIHWASTALLDLVEELAENLSDTPVLLVCTARVELLESRPTWGAGKQNATTLSLAPLSQGDSALLVSSLLGEAQVPENVRERVLESAEGNPFYLEEMLHMLIEEGALEQRNGGWVSTERLPDVSIPDSVHGVIAARIDLLEANARDALRHCSVVGRIFWPAAVDVDEGVVASLVRSGLVTDHLDSVMAGMREFAFKHALTRDVVYATLPRPERRELHRRVGDWIQDVAPDRSGETVELAAYHYGQALEYGEEDPALSRRAFELLLAASDTAFGRGAFEASRMQLDRALELTVDDTQRAAGELARARLDATEALNDRALERLDVVEALLGSGDAELRSEALSWRSRICWLSGRWDEALSSANDAVTALAGLPESPQLARAIARQSQIAMLKGKPESVERAREAIAVARRVGDSFAEVNARINIFTQLSTTGVAAEPDELASILDQAIRAGEYEEAYRAIVNFIWSASGYLPLERIEQVVSEARGRLADVPPPRSIGPYMEISTALLLLIPSARWAEADAIIEEFGDGEVGATMRLVFLVVAGGLASRRGDLDTAEQLFEELRPLALESGEPQRIIPMASVVLPWLAVTGDAEGLRSLATEILATLDFWPFVLDAVPVVRALAAGGETELLSRTIESMRDTPDASTNANTSAVRAGEGLLALAEGRPRDAAEQLEAVIGKELELGRTYSAACLELDLARAFEAADDKAAAQEARARASSILEPLGCVNPF
jgi:tetratricopeptide (TPR) repeat protein